MAKVNGSNLVLYIAGTAVGLSRSASLSDDTSTIDVTVKSTEGYADFIAGLQNSTVDFEALADFSNEDAIFEAWKAGTEVAWVMTDGASATAGNRFSGSGIINSLSISYGMEDVATVSGSMQVITDVTYTAAT